MSTTDEWEMRERTFSLDPFKCIEGFPFGSEPSQVATGRTSAISLYTFIPTNVDLKS